jgi:hypothetical protein
MSDLKYEPAPWEVNDQRDSSWMNNAMYIGSANTGLIIARVYTDKGDEEANARLIAAAPELLEALKAVVSVADRATVEFDMARAAIAKATGAA